MVEIGDDVTHVVPIYEGYCIQPGVRRIDFGGKDLTFALQKMLNEKGHSFATTGKSSMYCYNMIYNARR